MAKMVINKDSQTFGGEVNTSSRASFGLKTQAIIASISEAIQRIFTQLSHKPQCHSELGSESHVAKIPCQARDDKRGILPLCKALAFTLAETLIVMGIIGVVAALTIPNLNSSTADKEKVAKVKKLYQNFTDAFGRAQAVYGPLDEWDSSQNEELNYRITEFLKISKDCKQDVNAGCFEKNVKKIDNSADDGFDGWGAHTNAIAFILADGASVIMQYNSFIYFDIDGPNKGSNTWGKDIFDFMIINNEVKPQDVNSNDPLSGCFSYGSKCASWVIDNGNMDYLKADRTGKCPNGKILNWTTNTSCK